MIRPQLSLDLSDELIVDNFAGGGGASTGIELALGRSPDIAINHDREAVAMHQANHPTTVHECESVWDVDPAKVTAGRDVGLGWFSPDCKHFSKAKGGKPRDKNIRGLAWVVLRWIHALRADGRRLRVIILENVEEFTTWCPLTPDGHPSSWRKGWFFRCFVGALRRRGYVVDWRELRACDYGAPTTRKRFFLIARCDGRPIRWPAPTHGHPESDAVADRLVKPWRTAAECIDWTIPCPSIFTRSRDLAPATCRRIAKGLVRYVLDATELFTVAGESPVAAFLAKHYGGVVGARISGPIHTITSKDHHSVVMARLIKPAVAAHLHAREVRAFLVKYYATAEDGAPLTEPMHTITTRDRFGLVTVPIAGATYALADIGMRMLAPRELFSAQGFPADYVVDWGYFEDKATGRLVRRPLTKTAQVRMCGNSVCPPLAAALVAANVPELSAWSADERRARRSLAVA